MSVIQFGPVDFNGRVELFIVFKQFLHAGITLGFGEVKCLMKEVRQVDNAGWEFIWGDVNKFLDTMEGVQVRLDTVIQETLLGKCCGKGKKKPPKSAWTVGNWVVSS